MKLHYNFEAHHVMQSLYALFVHHSSIIKKKIQITKIWTEMQKTGPNWSRQIGQNPTPLYYRPKCAP